MNFNLSLLFLLSIATTSLCNEDSESPESRVPAGYEAWGNNFYKGYDVTKNWDNAQQTCQQDNGNLVVINSQEEAQFVRQLVINARKSSGLAYYGGWAGFRDSDGLANWQTLTGQNLDEAGYNVWWRNQDKFEKNMCGAIKTCGRFSAVPCDEKIVFVCEIEFFINTPAAQ